MIKKQFTSFLIATDISKLIARKILGDTLAPEEEAALQAWLSDEPFVHICGKRYVDRVEDVTKVTVYSNQPEVELFANGKSLGKQTSDVHFFYFEVPNAGETKLYAKAGACEDESMIRKVDTFNEAYRMKEKGAVLNWFDITAPEGYLSLNDKIQDIVKTEQGAMFVNGLFKEIMGKMSGENKEKAESAAKDGGAGLMSMMGSFTLIRLLNMIGIMGGAMTKEDMLALNAQLNKIKK